MADGNTKTNEAGDTAESALSELRDILGEYGTDLLRLAESSINHGLDPGEPLAVDPGDWPEALRRQGATFVTLKRGGKLRGCIGTIIPYRPLVTDIAENAWRAAFRDPRFPPLTVEERKGLDISLSVLGPMRELQFGSEEELLSLLVPGKDGLLIEDRGRRSVFLPQVWSDLPDPRTFLAHLKAKAGIPTEHRSKHLRAWNYRVIKIP